MLIHNGSPRAGSAAHAGPAAVDDLVGFWELRPRTALRDALHHHLGRALTGPCARRDVTCLSNWAARVAVDEIARQPACDRLRVAPPARPSAPDDWLRAHAAERGVPLAPARPGPAPDAGVVVAVGSLADTTDDDLAPLLRGVRQHCAAEAVVVWSHSLTWPDRARRVRSTFADLFAAVDVDEVGPGGCGSWFVGSAWTSTAAAGARS